ncbi:sensor histidine kinase [Sulfurisoma sediminicola]|uniref:histidine kinase n=1 Tax=Sulfurisoma sediminicola TaxID=1381557 RepID=A0A497XQJ9_9PROT|nr:sensor histidine kinase [Sulfurisoma sediminicola]RLJ68608.1 two-component system sensor histidine kinase TctE [Sulfurisoma sediminicola]
MKKAVERGKRGERFGSVFSDQNPSEYNSLFGEILDWMLAPLLLVWPISIAATHHIANDIANQPYDQALADRVSSIVSQLKVTPDGVSVTLPPIARVSLTEDEEDRQFHQVILAGGDLIEGDPDMPQLPVGEPRVPGGVKLRDGLMMGEQVRIAYQLVPAQWDARPLLIQVAETRKQREALASRIISGVLLPQFAIIPLAVILVYLGLSKGLAPLERLRDRIRARRPSDLSPIPVRGVPDEVRPLVVSFNEMMQRLEENLQAQQRFISDAAHQMKTPLTGLKMQAELALRETDPALMRADLERIAASTDRAAHLIYQLLQLARAEASHEKVHKAEQLGLEVLARAVTQDWVERAIAKGIDLGFEGTGRLLLIDGVPLLLREMLNNLIDNAIKYTQRGGHVTVRCRGDEFAMLEVEDDGPGIPEADYERVFERFYRVLGTDTDGSGLGLPIVQEVAVLHSATVELGAGAWGHGTRVTVVFPRKGSDVMPYDLRQKT